MANGDNNPITNQPAQNQQQIDTAELWARGIQDSFRRPMSYTPVVMMDEDERPPLSYYDQEIERITSNDQYYRVRDEANKRAMEMLVKRGGADPVSFFEKYSDPTPLDAIKFSNFDGYNDKSERYKDAIVSEKGYKEVMEGMDEEYMSRYISSFLSPEMAPGIDEMIPDYIRDNKERQADFEEAFRQQWGVGIDFNDSGRVSDVKADTWIGDFANWVGRDLLNDVPLRIADSVAALSNTITDFVTVGGIAEQDEKFLEQIEAGNIPTLEEYQAKRQTGEIGFLEDFFTNPYSEAALFSSEAREMYLQSALAPKRDIDFQKFMDRDDSGPGDVLALGVSQLIESAPLLVDIAGGMGAAKALLKKAGQRAIAKKVGQRTIPTRGKKGTTTQFFDPANPTRTLKKGDATDILERGTQVHRLLERTTGGVISSTLVAGQMHADLVGEEWYDNLSSSERAWYLANQSGAEVLSGIVLGNVMSGNTLLGRLGKSRITQNVIKKQRSAIMEWGKQAAKNTIYGITEEAASEAATAAWQYVSEVNTRINSGDRTAYYSNDELWKRVREAAVAGAVMGIPAGFIGGTVRPGAEAFVANYQAKKILANKELNDAVTRVDNARTKTEKKSALEALEEQIQNNSAVSGSIARAYHRMKQTSPEAFDKVVALQDRINVFVEQYKKAKTPEQQKAIKDKLKATIREKQTVENAAFEGDTTFEDVVKDEYEKTIDKRFSRGRKFKNSMESDPNVLAERALKGEKDSQVASLEAARQANSAEQNADDDVQDEQGSTEQPAQKRDDNYQAKPGERVTAEPGGTLAEGASPNRKYKTLRGTTNFFLKAFKRLGVSVVMHSTQESYTAATGNTSKGTFTKGKVVHINMAAEKTNRKTVRHEFYHAAYLTIDPKVKKQRLEELKRLLYTYVGKEEVDELIEDIEREYTDPSKGPVYSPEKLVEEKFVTLLERFADRIPIREESGLTKFGRGLANILRRLFGYSAKEAEVMIQDSELKQFIANFRAAERTGREFTGEQLSEAADIESREFGVRQPSKAYPDLINKVVNYRVYYLDKLGGQQSYQTNGLRFNDYWHFRNWYLKETGNGKMADNIGNFTYTGDDGTLKTISKPRPKVDRETGEIIDMEPRLKTPTQRKIETNQAQEARRKMASKYQDIKVAAGKALNFAVGKIEKIGKTGELAFYGDNMVLEQENQPDLPVAYSETFYVDGLNVDEITQLGKNFGENLQFAFPVSMGANFEFTVRNNGDGTVTIDTHTESTPSSNPLELESGKAVSGETNLEQREVRDRTKSEIEKLTNLIGRDIPVQSLKEFANGVRSVVVFYDPTTGERSGISADYQKGFLYSQSDEKGANETLGEVQQQAILELKKLMSLNSMSELTVMGIRQVDENGRVTFNVKIPLLTGLMSKSSLYGNADFIAEAVEQYRIYLNRFRDSEEGDIADKKFVKGFEQFLKSQLSKDKNSAQLDAIVDISNKYRLTEDTKNFNRVKASSEANEIRTIAIPKTAEGVLIMLDSIRKSQSEDFKNVNRRFRSKAQFIESLISEKSDFKKEIYTPFVDYSLIPDASIIRNRLRLSGKLALSESEMEEVSQGVVYAKVFDAVLEEVDSLGVGKSFELINAEVARQDSDDVPFPWAVRVINGEFDSETNEVLSDVGGGLLGEAVIQEAAELPDVFSKYVPKGKGTQGTKARLAKYGAENIGDIEEAIEKRQDEIKASISDWKKQNIDPETDLGKSVIRAEAEMAKIDTIIGAGKKVSEVEKARARKRKQQLLSTRARYEGAKLFQELYGLKQQLEEARSDKSAQRSANRALQNAALGGMVAIRRKVATEESTVDALERYRKATELADQTVEAETLEEVDGMESRELSSKSASSQGWEPNNMNAFQGFMAYVDQKFANKYANVFSLQRAIESAQKAVVDISQDFINAETLMYGKTANDLDKLDEKVKVISQEMKSSGLSSADVSDFLIARHAEERNALIAERTNGEMIDGSGMSNERAQEVMDSFTSEEKAALESIGKKVDAITADTRKAMVEFGLETKETIDAFENMFDFYVPLGGLSSDEMSADTSLYPTGGAGMSIYGDSTRRARGRKSQANNVLAQAISQNAAVHAKGRKNEALSSLYNLVENNPNKRVWMIKDDAPFDAQGAIGVRINGEQKFIVFQNADHAKALKNMGVEKLDVFSKFMRRFSGFLRRSFTTANPEFIISNFARDIQSALFNAMAEADMPGGQIESKYIATRVIQRVKETLPSLLKDAVGREMSAETAAYFEEFKEDGGQTGWGFVKDVGTIAAEIEAEVNEKNKAQKARDWMMQNSIGVVENVNDAFENSIRLAAYIEAREAGASREKAAELAKNITVNFNRSGELGAVANAWYMFFNASVQGTVRLARSLGPNALRDVRKPDGELESWNKRLNGAQKLAFGLSLITGMLTTINLGLSEEDEDGELFYNKIPDYEKERNLIIMYDGKNYLKVPLPYGFNVFANLGTAMAESAAGHREPLDAGMFLLNSAFSSFSPISFGQSKDAAKYLAKGATPTFLKPFVDIAVNETYFGTSVYRQQFPVGAPKPESEMSFRSPEAVRGLFKWMNEATGGTEFVPGKLDFNPDKFWYGFEYYIGGAGQFVTRTMGTTKDLYETITTEGEKVPMKANDFPFLRKLYGEPSKFYDADVYTDNANLVSQLFKERKEAENKGDKRYRNINKLESERKRTERQIKRLRKLRREARDISDYVERQQRIYELYEKERSLLMQFNKQFEKLRGKD